MAITNNELANEICQISNNFEYNTSNLKKKYFAKNILAFKSLSNLVPNSCGVFGSGFPYYALSHNFSGDIPIIQEQIRYNQDLVNDAQKAKNAPWICAGCLIQNYDMMPDLKQICKPCPNVINEMKPRKILNRLPDLDIWFVCKDNCRNETAQAISQLLSTFGMTSSDINPIETIKDLKEISTDLSKGIMPKHFLPIDVHIIEESQLKNLINAVYPTLEASINTSTIPYLPVLPLSLRKTWQFDDTAYNFLFDFLFSFTPINLDNELIKVTDLARHKISSNFSSQQLKELVFNMATDSTKRRIQTQSAIFKNLTDKFDFWRRCHELTTTDIDLEK